MNQLKFTNKLSPYLLFVGLLTFSCQESKIDLRIKSLDQETVKTQVKAIEASVSPVLTEGLKLSIWAVDSLVYDPISIQMTDQGELIYSRTNRQKDSEFDIRGHQDWEIRSISLQNIEEKRAFLHAELSPERSSENTWLADLNGDGSHDWRDMTVQKEQIYRLKDTDGDGYADQSQLMVEDFNDEVTDVAGAVMMGEDALYVGVGPDMWRMVDKNGDGIMDEKSSISHGYGIHIGFGAHGMSGLEMGPDGRVYWGIGDIGFNGTGPDGKEWKYPNRGVIARANPDGSDFEIFAMGVRNTHEFVFDAQTNLISVDNDGDHPGEKERLVYLTNGSDSGWRTNWQFGKYRDPDNNSYKVWMDEKMFLPRWEGQAAFITPCIQNYVSGPTGMVYNPGTALGSKWKDSFFVVEFVGSPARSGIHAFKLQNKGASFELTQTEQILSGVLPTGLDFGPDGALYLADWIDGWGTKNYGRVWKLEEENSDLKVIQADTEQKLRADFKKLNATELKSNLYHEDMRVRRKAQFELAKREKEGFQVFQEVIKDRSNQLARIHAIVGISQLARLKDISYAQVLVPLLNDQDPEIKAQAAKWLGDIRYSKAENELISNLKDVNKRVQFFAAEALGRTASQKSLEPLITLLQENNDEDAYIRHAATLALSRIGKVQPLAALSSHPSKAVRLGAVIALRRLESPELAKFLNDTDEFIVTEAALAIHDDFSVPTALPALAKLIGTTPFRNEPLVRRIISANQRVGADENLMDLLAFLSQSGVPLPLKKEAIAAVGTWAKPSLVDRVDGRYRGEINRDPGIIREISKKELVAQLNSSTEDLRLESVKALGKLSITEAEDLLFEKLKTDPSAAVKVAALNSLKVMNSAILGKAIARAMVDQDQALRVAGLAYLAETDLPQDQKVSLLSEIIQKRSIPEKQTALLTLGGLSESSKLKEWEGILTQFKSGNLPEATWVELEEAIKATKSSELESNFKATLEEKSKGEPWKQYQGALAEGSVRNGRGIFFENQTAQCIRCHAYDDMGGNAGPRLSGIANKLSREELLIALVEPSARLAPGFGMINLELNSGEKVSGTLMTDNSDSVVVKVGSEPEKTIPKSEIKTSKTAMSSMPPMGTLLSKRELRDLVSFLSTLNRD
jgi:putative membrane-bound dehydrogenase-like protein